ncbi:MAG: hypothetical protein ACK5WZ_00715 [Pseudobdellovibrionaceae bacterium]
MINRVVKFTSIENRASRKALFYILSIQMLFGFQIFAQTTPQAEKSQSPKVEGLQSPKVEGLQSPKVENLQTPKVQSSLTETFFLLCKLQKNVRTLRVIKANDKYDTIYTKNGKDQVIGQTRLFSSGKGIANGVKEKLAVSGWTCREVSDSKLTTSETN